MEGDLDALSNLIFYQDLNPKSISITGTFDNIKDLFEALLMLTTKGMKMLFGDGNLSVDLNNLTLQQFEIFSRKMQAIGVIPKFQKYHLYQVLKTNNNFITTDVIDDWKQNQQSFQSRPSEKELTKYKNINKDNLEDYYFQIKCGYIVFIICYRLI